jgi:hypothetical protein
MQSRWQATPISQFVSLELYTVLALPHMTSAKDYNTVQENGNFLKSSYPVPKEFSEGEKVHEPT